VRLMARLVSALALLPAVAAPTAQAQTLMYVDRLAVYDATGRQVGSAGPHWGNSDGFSPPYMEVKFRLGSIPVTVRLGENAIYSTAFLRFSSPGCTGEVMLDEQGYFGRIGVDLPVTAVVGPRRTVYVQSGNIRLRTVRSTLIASGACSNLRGEPKLRSALLRATDIHLVDHFVPPFTIRGRVLERVPE
jgi:hypothetical protein